MKIDAYTDLYCIFGSPVKHSLSPLIHNTAFNQLSINAVYMAFSPDTIESGLEAMKSLNIKGASVTIPYKIEVMNFLDSIDPLAAEIGSVNTIKNINGELLGFNTDGKGAIKALMDKGVSVNDTRFLIIGNGGSARAIAFTLLNQKGKISITGRNKSKIDDLRNDLNEKYHGIETITISDLTPDEMNNFDVIINTTPVGMNPDIDKSPIDTSLITKDHVVFDIIYSPYETKLIKDSKEKGCKIVYGIEMLVNQGVLQFEKWRDIKAPEKEIKKIIQEKIKSMQ